MLLSRTTVEAERPLAWGPTSAAKASLKWTPLPVDVRRDGKYLSLTTKDWLESGRERVADSVQIVQRVAQFVDATVWEFMRSIENDVDLSDFERKEIWRMVFGLAFDHVDRILRLVRAEQLKTLMHRENW